MFNSKKGNNSHYLNNSTLPVVNDTCNGVPKMTSTPLHPQHLPVSRRSTVLLSPTKSKLVTPRRYSLSEINSPTNKSNLTIQGAHCPGPLLASLSFTDNVSMYEETKSSGLARRIVLYNEETEQERHPTHQEKYHSPGLFPIVHLFKKKPPLLEQSPKKVKIKLSSPDYLKNNSPQHRSKLLEGLARPRLRNQHNLSSCSQKSDDIGTKSVLDALKEISRKRIHANEEYDLHEDSGKRIRTELQNGATTTSKRIRADSPPLESSESPPLKQTQKKMCVYDEFAASKSSTDFSFLNKMEPSRSKRKTISTSTDSLKETKHVKLINAETQTILSSNESKTQTDESVSDESDSQKAKKKESPLKVFDDAPLDRIRKNRLAALMGNLAGKDAAILPKPTTADNLASESKGPEEKAEPLVTANVPEEILAPITSMTEKENKSETDLSIKPLISILSPPKTMKELSPVKSDKHVHFILPGINSGSTLNQTLLTETSAPLVTPIVSFSVSNSSISNNTEKSTSFSLPITSVGLNTKSITTPSSTLSFSFQNSGASKSDTHISSAIGSSGSSTSPLFSFPTSLPTSKQDTSSIPKLSFEVPKTSSTPKLGGFKFELKTPSSIGLVSTTDGKMETPTLTLSHPSLVSTSSGTISTTSLSSSSPATFIFDKPAELKKDSTFSFGTTTPANSSATSELPFAFGRGISKSQTFNTITTESKLPSLNPTTTIGFSFDSTGNTPKFAGFATGSQTTAAATFGTTTTTTTSSSTFGTTLTSRDFGACFTAFGAPSTTLPPFGNTQNAVTTTTGMFAFGESTAMTSTPGFGTKPTPAFGISNTPAASTTMFGNSGTAAIPRFGNIAATTPSVFGSTLITPTSGFGSIPVTSAPVFGSTPNTSITAFGNTQVTSTPIFGNTSTHTSVFGSTPTTSTSVFGSTNTSTASGFGGAAPTTSSHFGSNTSTFSSNPSATPVFDTKTPSFGSSSGFSSANAQSPTFGNNTTPGFANTSNPKPIFGTSSTTANAPPAFGSNTFGSTGTVTTTTSAPVFGASNPNPTFSFGSNKPATNVFGSVTTSSSTFGNNTFSTSGAFAPNSGFGNNTPAFGSSTTSASTFGATSAPAFGQTENKPTFSQTENKSAFGQTENKPAFAFGGSTENKANPVFGSGAGNSAFGKPTSTQGGFGSSAGGFGSTSTSGFNSQQTNGGFNFGSNAASSTPAPFAFGGNSTNVEPPKPTFNFTGGTTNTPAFGSNSSTPAFGSSNPNFGVPAPTFGVTGSPATGVFNIGAGSNTGRPRTQLRAKRRN